MDPSRLSFLSQPLEAEAPPRSSGGCRPRAHNRAASGSSQPRRTASSTAHSSGECKAGALPAPSVADLVRFFEAALRAEGNKAERAGPAGAWSIDRTISTWATGRGGVVGVGTKYHEWLKPGIAKPSNLRRYLEVAQRSACSRRGGRRRQGEVGARRDVAGAPVAGLDAPARERRLELGGASSWSTLPEPGHRRRVRPVPRPPRRPVDLPVGDARGGPRRQGPPGQDDRRHAQPIPAQLTHLTHGARAASWPRRRWGGRRGS
jgi:hypothetical protein